MKNTIEVISSQEKSNLVNQAKEICPASMIKKLKNIMAGIGSHISPDMTENKKAFWKYHFNKMISLPASNNFRKDMIDQKRWKNIKEDGSILVDYLKYTGNYSDYQHLCSPVWNELESFGAHVLPCYSLPSTGLGVFFGYDGDYDLYLSQFLANNLEPERLKKTKELKDLIDKTFKGLPTEARINLANLMMSVSANVEPLTIEALHRKLFPGSRTCL